MYVLMYVHDYLGDGEVGFWVIGELAYWRSGILANWVIGEVGYWRTDWVFGEVTREKYRITILPNYYPKGSRAVLKFF